MGRESFSQCAEAEELARQVRFRLRISVAVTCRSGHAQISVRIRAAPQVIRELDHGLDAVDASAAASSSDAGAAALREKLVKKCAATGSV